MKKGRWLVLLGVAIGLVLFGGGYRYCLEREKGMVVERVANRAMEHVLGKKFDGVKDAEGEMVWETVRVVSEDPGPIRSTLPLAKRQATKGLELPGFRLRIEAPERLENDGENLKLNYPQFEVSLGRRSSMPELEEVPLLKGEGRYDRELRVLRTTVDEAKDAKTFGQLRDLEERLYLKVMSQPIKVTGPRREVVGDGFVGLLTEGGRHVSMGFRAEHDVEVYWGLGVRWIGETGESWDPEGAMMIIESMSVGP
ncbi:MAG: hypothetical protein O3A92_16570 [Verrucomicrobia bacterium]|nr:hypothetical protein [Verrucomicrobiota bacterium]